MANPEAGRHNSVDLQFGDGVFKAWVGTECEGLH